MWNIFKKILSVGMAIMIAVSNIITPVISTCDDNYCSCSTVQNNNVITYQIPPNELVYNNNNYTYYVNTCGVSQNCANETSMCVKYNNEYTNLGQFSSMVAFCDKQPINVKYTTPLYNITTNLWFICSNDTQILNVTTIDNNTDIYIEGVFGCPSECYNSTNNNSSISNNSSVSNDSSINNGTSSSNETNSNETSSASVNASISDSKMNNSSVSESILNNSMTNISSYTSSEINSYDHITFSVFSVVLTVSLTAFFIILVLVAGIVFICLRKRKKTIPPKNETNIELETRTNSDVSPVETRNTAVINTSQNMTREQEIYNLQIESMVTEANIV